MPKTGHRSFGCATSPQICCQAIRGCIASWWPSWVSKYRSTRPCTPNCGTTINMRPWASYRARGCGHRLAGRTTSGRVLAVGLGIASPPDHSHRRATVAADSHRPGCGGEIQIPRRVCGTHIRGPYTTRSARRVRCRWRPTQSYEPTSVSTMGT